VGPSPRPSSSLPIIGRTAERSPSGHTASTAPVPRSSTLLTARFTCRSRSTRALSLSSGNRTPCHDRRPGRDVRAPRAPRMAQQIYASPKTARGRREAEGTSEGAPRPDIQTGWAAKEVGGKEQAVKAGANNRDSAHRKPPMFGTAFTSCETPSLRAPESCIRSQFRFQTLGERSGRR